MFQLKFVIGRLDVVFAAISGPKIEPIPSTSGKPTSENGQTETVSAQIVSPNVSPSVQAYASSPQVKLPKLELKGLMGMSQGDVLSGTLMRLLFTKILT